jgi:hypothetical protein
MDKITSTLYRLNDKFVLQVAFEAKEGYLNGYEFQAQDKWVIKKDLGAMYATRYQYTTTYAKDNRLYFSCANAKAAIQQVLIDACKGKMIKDIYFRVLTVKK